MPPDLRVVARRSGIAYADERPYDRDGDGVLWTRVPSLPGKGRPEFGQVHALRQMRAMRELLCQVCGGPADRDGDGILWLLGEDPGAGDVLTCHPAVCAPCAARSVRACPHLRHRTVALRVRACRPVGVRGALYRPGHPDPVATDVAGLAFDDPRVRWLRAGQLIVRLRDFTALSLAPATPEYWLTRAARRTVNDRCRRPGWDSCDLASRSPVYSSGSPCHRRASSRPHR